MSLRTKNKTGNRPAMPWRRRASVVEILGTGEILVEISQSPPQRVLCDFLESASNSQIALHPGDPVLVLPPARLDEKGCVLGRVGRYRAPETRHVVITADEDLTIECGEGSITLKKTGQVLIKGLDIVSHAKRRNRMRGGSIQLN